MRRRTYGGLERQRGVSAAEMALLVGAIALVMIGSLFVLGNTLGDQLELTCETVAGNECSAGGDGDPPPDGGSGSTPPTRALESAVARQLAAADPARGTPDVDCPTLAAFPPPEGTRTTCTVQYPSEPRTSVEVVFTDDAGSFTTTG